MIVLASATKIWAACPGGECITSADQTAVAAAVATAVDGDKITILANPTSPAHWTQPLIITKGITIQGATTVGGDQWGANGFTVNDQTIIIDDIVTGDLMISVTLPSSSPSPAPVASHFELSGITFQPGLGPNPNGNLAQFFHLDTSPTSNVVNKNLRIWGNHFASVKRRIMVPFGLIYGLFDHNQVEMVPGFAVYYVPPGFGGTTGNAQWADYSWYGTGDFFFIEDNFIKATTQRGLTDCVGALRAVVRYNHIINAAAGDHGTEGAPTRGGRATEWYKNVLDLTLVSGTANWGNRSGSKLAHDNEIKKSGVTSLGVLENFRAFGGAGGSGPGSWGNADGHGPWDKCVNTVDNTGTPIGGFPDLNQAKQSWVDGAGTPPVAPAPPYLFYSGQRQRMILPAVATRAH